MNEKKYVSTRGQQRPLDFCDAILQGIGSDGGLLVPDFELDQKDLKALQHLSYVDMATEIMTSFVGEEEKEEMRALCQKAYGQNLFPQEVVPVKQAGDVFIAELFQGPTAAFKDMALSLLPHFMTYSLKKKGEQRKVMILAATSGDTGKAALAGFADVEGTKIIVFYPKNGVSPVQEKQMVTQKGENTYVVGITGNFDDAQTGVKKMFNDKEMARELAQAGYQFSSANSINIGRLVPQVAYYVYAYVKLMERGEIRNGDEINAVVPTGNFGNILAAYYAKQMGVPYGKFICASNENKVLFDFFRTGCYDRNREFILTSSPSMDILISSNLERLIYRAAGDDSEKNKELMKALTEKGSYQITPEMEEGLKEFYGNYATEEETADTIRGFFEENQYVLDTHTAVAADVYKKYMEEIEQTESKIADLQVYLKGIRNALKEEEDKEMVKSIRGMNLDRKDLHALLNGLRDGNVTFQVNQKNEKETIDGEDMNTEKEDREHDKTQETE